MTAVETGKQKSRVSDLETDGGYGVGVTVTQTLKVSDLDENFF